MMRILRILALAALAVSSWAGAGPCDLTLGDGALSFIACHASGMTESELMTLSMRDNKLPAHCIPARVPGTVLATLLEAGAFNLTRPGDPYFADELVSRIPDISEAGAAYYTYAYILDLPQALPHCVAHATSRVRFELRAASYHVRAWSDGSALSGGKSSAGMFRRRTFELGPAPRRVVVLAAPPTFIGIPNVGQGGNHSVAENAALMQCTAGWDWVKAAPDRNTGLWDKVSLLRSGAVTVEDPVVRTVSVDALTRSEAEVEADAEAGVATNGTGAFAFGRARVEVGATLSRAGAVGGGDDYTGAGGVAARNSGLVNGVLRVVLASDDGSVVLRRDVQVLGLQAGERREVWLRSDDMLLPRARLWWPHSHGQPALHFATLAFHEMPSASAAAAGAEDAAAVSPSPSHVARLRFGVRTVETRVDSANAGRVFLVNGRRVFLAGGNWIATDQLLRFSGGDEQSRQRYMAEVRMHRDMGLNLIRVWGGGIAERPEFYDAADEMGVLVMQEFWMTGDNNGRWAGEYSWPVSHQDYLDNARDTVLLLRSHPSLLFWCGGNELYPQPRNPNPQILAGLEDILRDLDGFGSPGGRFFIASSMSNETAYDAAYALAPKDGPYGVLRGSQFFERNPGLYMWEDHRVVRADRLALGFQPEIGSVSTPVLRSLRRFLSPAALMAFPAEGATEAEGGGAGAHDEWAFHKFLPYTGGATTYEGDGKYDFLYALGPPKDIEGYAARAQIVQFEQFRALFEGFQARMWAADGYNAVVFWKSQGPWPALRGAMYDWYLAPTAGLAGVQAALVDGHKVAGSARRGGAAHAHLQLDQRKGTLHVVRRGFGRAIRDARAIARWFDACGRQLSVAASVQLPFLAPDAVTIVPGEPLEWPSPPSSPRPPLASSSDGRDHNAECSVSADAAGFVLLRTELRHGSSLLSRSDYVLAPPGRTAPGMPEHSSAWPSSQQNMTALSAVRELGPHARVEVSQVKVRRANGTNAKAMRVSATVLNNARAGTGALALYNAVQLLRRPNAKGDDDRVLPAFYSSNYFLLLPGESRDVDVQFDCGIPTTVPCNAEAHIGLEVQPWNAPKVVVWARAESNS